MPCDIREKKFFKTMFRRIAKEARNPAQFKTTFTVFLKMTAFLHKESHRENTIIFFLYNQ